MVQSLAPAGLLHIGCFTLIPKDLGYGLHDLVHEFARAQGQAFFEQEAIFRRQQGDVESTLSTLTWLVAFYNQQGDVERAIAAYKELGALARLIGDTHNEIGALDHIGDLLGHQGRTMDAIAFHERALLQARELDSTEWLESSFLQLPPLYEKVGRWEDVVRLHKERRDRAHQRGDTKKEIDATWDIARTFDTAKQTPRAIETYEEYLALVRSRATEKPMSLVFGRLWNLYNQQGNYSQAARYLREYIDAHRTFLEGESTDLDMTKTLEDLEAQYHRLLKQAEHS